MSTVVEKVDEALHTPVGTPTTVNAVASVFAPALTGIISAATKSSNTSNFSSYSMFGATDPRSYVWNYFGLIVTIVALAMAYKCSGISSGFSPEKLVEFLIAWCCSCCYIFYRLIVRC